MNRKLTIIIEIETSLTVFRQQKRIETLLNRMPMFFDHKIISIKNEPIELKESDVNPRND